MGALSTVRSTTIWVGMLCGPLLAQDPGASSSLRLIGGNLNGQPLSSANRTISVTAAGLLTGQIDIQINSSYGSNAAMAMGITPTWGPHATSFMDLGTIPTPVSLFAKTIPVNVRLPDTPGTYYLIAAYRGEFTAAQVMSATSYTTGSPVWNNGDDIADWSTATIDTANATGTVRVNYLYPSGNIPQYVPATAIKIVVSPAIPPPPSTGGAAMLSYDFNNGSSIGWQTFDNPGWIVSSGVYQGLNRAPDTAVETVWSTGYSWTDYTVQADVSIQDGYTPSDGDLLFRYQDRYTYGSCRLFQDDRGSSLDLYSFSKMNSPLLGQIPFKFQLGKWYTLRVSVTGQDVTCEVVGVPGLSISARFPGSTSGTIGLRNTHIPVYFDNVSVISTSVSRTNLVSDTTDLSFSGVADGSPIPASFVSVNSSIVGLPFTVSVQTQIGEAWLKPVLPPDGRPLPTPFSLTVIAQPAGLAPGTYRGSITLLPSFSLGIPGSPGPLPVNINVTLTVRGVAVNEISAQPTNLSFSTTLGASPPTAQLLLSAVGQPSVSFALSTSTESGGDWLIIPPLKGVLDAQHPVSIPVAVNSVSLAAGTYRGKILVTSSSTGQQITTLVDLAIGRKSQRILLSQTGLTFRASAGGGKPLPQQVGILNTGSGAMPWSARIIKPAGTRDWLKVTPASGTVDVPFKSVSFLQISADPAGLDSGDYYASIQVSATGSDNSPQAISAVLNVLPKGSNPGVEVRPTGLIFIGTPKQRTVAPQSVLFADPTSDPLNYTSSHTTSDPLNQNWIAQLPTFGSVDPNQPGTLTVQPDFTALDAGVRSAAIFLSFTNADLSVRQSRAIDVLVVLGPDVGRNSTSSKQNTAGGCVPKTLKIVSTQLGDSYVSSIGWPTPIEALVVDDCGNTLDTGSVTASFDNGDAPISLNFVGSGIWADTWKPRNANQAVTITLEANLPTPPISARKQITVGLQKTSGAPVIAAGGILNGASYARNEPLAPGSFFSIFGSQLASGTAYAGTVPLPLELAGTRVLLAGTELPILATSEGQVNTIVPWDVPLNTPQQLIVFTKNAYSVPESIVVAAVQPAIFTTNQSGTGAAIAVSVSADGIRKLITLASPAHPGDVIEVYCTGLGSVTAPPILGSGSPLSPLSSAMGAVTAYIAGQPATVLFAGLAPGLVGVFQVNLIVPTSIAPASDATLAIAVSGQSSRPVTLAIQ